MGANTNRNERLISVSNFVRVCAIKYIKKQKKLMLFCHFCRSKGRDKFKNVVMITIRHKV